MSDAEIAKEEMDKAMKEEEQKTEEQYIKESKDELLAKVAKLENSATMTDLEKKYYDAVKRNKELEKQLLEKQRGRASVNSDEKVGKPPDSEIEDIKKNMPLIAEFM